MRYVEKISSGRLLPGQKVVVSHNNKEYYRKEFDKETKVDAVVAEVLDNGFIMVTYVNIR